MLVVVRLPLKGSRDAFFSHEPRLLRKSSVLLFMTLSAVKIAYSASPLCSFLDVKLRSGRQVDVPLLRGRLS